jgi:toxin YoeB
LRLVFTPRGWADHTYWQSRDIPTIWRINYLLERTIRAPTTGTGNPTALHHVLEGCWSRRINAEHRLVYLVKEDEIVVIQERQHYE